MMVTTFPLLYFLKKLSRSITIYVHRFLIFSLYMTLPMELLNFINNILIIPDNFFNKILTSSIQLLAVVEPFGIIPILINLTKEMEKETSKALSKTAAVTSALLLMVFGIAGTQILSTFGITVSSFMVAGGALLFIVSLEIMRHGELRNIKNEINNTGVVPIAFPLIAGPGAITSVMISHQNDGPIVTLISIIIVISITYLVLRLIKPIYRVLGNRGSEVISRIFAVILAAIAIQYIVEGLRKYYHTITKQTNTYHAAILFYLAMFCLFGFFFRFRKSNSSLYNIIIPKDFHAQ